MPHYALLLAPSASRVYTAAAPRLALAELTVLAAALLAGPVHDARVEPIADVEYLLFDSPADDDAVATDTTRVAEYLSRGTFDLVVGDLPYGVEHGSRSGADLARRPAELLAAALRRWAEMLRSGEVIALSFNPKVQRRDLLLEDLTAAGLEPVALPDFDHRVDSSIHRDLVVACRP